MYHDNFSPIMNLCFSYTLPLVVINGIDIATKKKKIERSSLDLTRFFDKCIEIQR